MKKNIYFIITIVGILLLILILFFIRRDNFNLSDVTYKDVLNVVEDDGFSIVYNSAPADEVKDILKLFNEEYLAECYYSSFTVDEINELVSEYDLSTETDDVILLFVEGEPVAVIPSSTTYERFVELIEKYLFNKIPESERYYQVLSTADEYIKKVNSKNYTVAVFGVSDCTYCDLYLPVINDIARDYNVNIYYFNRDTYDTDEYDKIMDLNFEIPAKCTTTGYPTTLGTSFPKPMTIITKSGKFVDCIRGYVTKETVLDMFKEYKIVKEK